MWLWILISFKLVSELQGYSHGNFPQSCDSMLPEHGGTAGSQTSNPYMVTCKNCDSPGDPLTVTIESKESRTFLGFMLEARNASLGGSGPPVGKFIALDTTHTNLLTCNGSPGSAVSNKNNWDKTSFSVNWTSGGADCNIIFRATVLEKFKVHWPNVDYMYCRPAVNPDPKPCIIPKMEIYGLVAMCVENIVEGMSWTMPHFFHRTKSHLKKGLVIACSAACALLTILSLVFFSLVESYKAALITLSSLVIEIIIVELGCFLAPFGPSHELREICDLAHQACCIIHHVLTNAILLVGVVNYTYLCEENKKLNWLFYILIGNMVWNRLNEIWVSGLNVRKGRLQKNGNVNSEDQHESQGILENLCANKMDIQVAVTFMIVNLLFPAVVIFGLFQCLQN